LSWEEQERLRIIYKVGKNSRRLEEWIGLHGKESCREPEEIIRSGEVWKSRSN
jgi:hypothetical protein